MNVNVRVERRGDQYKRAMESNHRSNVASAFGVDDGPPWLFTESQQEGRSGRCCKGRNNRQTGNRGERPTMLSLLRREIMNVIVEEKPKRMAVLFP